MHRVLIRASKGRPSSSSTIRMTLIATNKFSMLTSSNSKMIMTSLEHRLPSQVSDYFSTFIPMIYYRIGRIFKKTE